MVVVVANVELLGAEIVELWDGVDQSNSSASRLSSHHSFDHGFSENEIQKWNEM